jgi:PTS system nitrogen regulatory IIA component
MMQPRATGKLAELVVPDGIRFLKTRDRDEALRELVAAAADADKLHDPEAFLKAVREREKLVSTGIGLGVAIPHAKLSDQPDFFICVGVAPEGIDWGALDGEPCRLVFLIGGPDNRPNDYLQILSSLTVMLREEEIRKNMLKSSSPLDILSSFKGF